MVGDCRRDVQGEDEDDRYAMSGGATDDVHLRSCGNHEPHASTAISHMADSAFPESYSATTGEEDAKRGKANYSKYYPDHSPSSLTVIPFAEDAAIQTGRLPVRRLYAPVAADGQDEDQQ